MPLIIGSCTRGSETNVFGDEDDVYNLTGFNTDSQKYYRITLTESHGMCSSGYTTASWGLVSIYDYECSIRKFNHSSRCSVDSSIFDIPTIFECEYFEYGRYGGEYADKYYPTGYVRMYTYRIFRDIDLFKLVQEELLDVYLKKVHEKMKEVHKEKLKEVHDELFLVPPIGNFLGGPKYYKIKDGFYECSGGENDNRSFS